jgi:hypothetical protein
MRCDERTPRAQSPVAGVIFHGAPRPLPESHFSPARRRLESRAFPEAAASSVDTCSRGRGQRKAGRGWAGIGVGRVAEEEDAVEEEKGGAHARPAGATAAAAAAA